MSKIIILIGTKREIYPDHIDQIKNLFKIDNINNNGPHILEIEVSSKLSLDNIEDIIKSVRNIIGVVHWETYCQTKTPVEEYQNIDIDVKEDILKDLTNFFNLIQELDKHNCIVKQTHWQSMCISIPASGCYPRGMIAIVQKYFSVTNSKMKSNKKYIATYEKDNHIQFFGFVETNTGVKDAAQNILDSVSEEVAMDIAKHGCLEFYEVKDYEPDGKVQITADVKIKE